MFETFWEEIEKCDRNTTYAEILAWTYFNNPSIYLRDIMPEFDKWTIDMFEDVIEVLSYMGSLEGDSFPEEDFGIEPYTCHLPFNEGANLTKLPIVTWKNTSHSKKRFF